MRLLFLTNFYPPASRGGYEMWCQEVAEGLKADGHDVVILTSRYKGEEAPQEMQAWVHRQLYLEMDFTPLLNGLRFFVGREARERRNIAYLEQLVETLAPDAILVWGMWNLQRSLAACAERLMPNRVAYYLGDYWPTLPTQSEMYWQTPDRHWLTRLPKDALRTAAKRVLKRQTQPALQLDHGLFPTAFMRDELESQGVSFQQTSIIHGAVDTSPYRSLHPERFVLAESAGVAYVQDCAIASPLSLLYIGRLTHDKGVHTAIEALAHLVHQHGLADVTLTIVGRGSSAYEAHLREIAEREGITASIHFLGWLPKAQLPKLYQASDIFLFTSIWAEPFGRILVEAMASGVAVVGTGTGGSAEILDDGENALLFAPEDGPGLAAQILRLYETPALYHQLVVAGRQTAVDKFDIQKMTAKIERYMKSHVI